MYNYLSRIAEGKISSTRYPVLANGCDANQLMDYEAASDLWKVNTV